MKKMPQIPPNPKPSQKHPEMLFSNVTDPRIETIFSPKSPKPNIILASPKTVPVGPKVLLVDDQEFNVKILADLMTMAMGLKVDKDYMGTYDGQQALDLVKSYGNLNPFKVILMDLTMPVLDGYQSSKQIMEYCKSAGCEIIPVIYAVTASDKNDTELKKC